MPGDEFERLFGSIGAAVILGGPNDNRAAGDGILTLTDRPQKPFPITVGLWQIAGDLAEPGQPVKVRTILGVFRQERLATGNCPCRIGVLLSRQNLGLNPWVSRQQSLANPQLPPECIEVALRLGKHRQTPAGVSLPGINPDGLLVVETRLARLANHVQTLTKSERASVG